jgi:hypothetical protein
MTLDMKWPWDHVCMLARSTGPPRFASSVSSSATRSEPWTAPRWPTTRWPSSARPTRSLGRTTAPARAHPALVPHPRHHRNAPALSRWSPTSAQVARATPVNRMPTRERARTHDEQCAGRIVRAAQFQASRTSRGVWPQAGTPPAGRHQAAASTGSSLPGTWLSGSAQYPESFPVSHPGLDWLGREAEHYGSTPRVI